MSGEEPATQIAPVESPQMVSTVKLPILKKGEYTLWSMRMEQYLTNTDYSLWQVILNGDGPIKVTTDEKGVETEVPPKTAQALLQRQRERKYQLRFHEIKDEKSLWAAIKSRFGGNVESEEDAEDCFDATKLNFSVSDTEECGLSLYKSRLAAVMKINTANGVSTASGHNSQGQASSSSYTNDLMFSFFANQSNSPQLDD
ncbi:hypothetical protein Tco_0584383 [Tanacetum coccineum]